MKNRIEKALEISRRLEMLSKQDKLVLHSIQTGPIDYVCIAAQIYVLPSLVSESLDKLLELDFISQSKSHLDINPNGMNAQKLLKVIEKNS